MNPLWSLITSCVGWLLAHPELWLPWVGVAVIVAANWTNITGTWGGRWGTSVVTWTIWAGLGWVALVAQIQLGALIGVVLLVPVTAVSTAVAAGAWWDRQLIRQGRRLPRRVDEPSWQPWVNRVCAVGGAAAFAALLVSTVGLVLSSSREALALTIITDGIAAVPTLVKARQEPQGQPLPCFVGGAAALCTLAAAPDWSFDQAGYAAYLFALCSFIAIVIVVSRARLSAAAVRKAGETRSPAAAASAVSWSAAQSPRDVALRSAAAALPSALRTGRADTVWAPAAVLAVALDDAVDRAGDEVYRSGHRHGWMDCAAALRQAEIPGHGPPRPGPTHPGVSATTGQLRLHAPRS